jgi:hypothetical protein
MLLSLPVGVLFDKEHVFDVGRLAEIPARGGTEARDYILRAR